MITSIYGVRIPETKDEFWELYNSGRIVYVPMRSSKGLSCEVPSYEVVAMLLKGWSFNVNEINMLKGV